MVYLVGGYLLTIEQVFDFAERKGFEIPSIDATTLCSNRWLKSQSVPFRLLAASYEGQPRIILVTRAKHRSDETKDNFTPFSQRPEDQVVKGKMVEWDERLKDVEYVTVANPYGTP
jgi:hypothetical protein